MKAILFLILALFLGALSTQAQRNDLLTPKEKREHAQTAIVDLKERGAMVLRLKTDHRKISLLEKTIASTTITETQRRRHEKLLANTIRSRDAYNEALRSAFTRAFDFCPVYIMYDTSTRYLEQGMRSGMFLNGNKQLDNSIQLDEEAIFLVNFKSKSADFPYDVLRVRRLEEKLEDPFPLAVPIRESWLNEVNSPRAAKSVEQLNTKLHNYYGRVQIQLAKQVSKDTP